MEIRNRNIIKKIKQLDSLSLKYHKMSQLFNELARSVEAKAKRGAKYSEIQEDLKGINFDKIKEFTFETTGDLRK